MQIIVELMIFYQQDSVKLFPNDDSLWRLVRSRLKLKLLGAIKIALITLIANMESKDSKADDAKERDETEEERNTNDHTHVTNVLLSNRRRYVDYVARAVDGTIVSLDGAIVDTFPALEIVDLINRSVDGISEDDPVDTFSARRRSERTVVGVVARVGHHVTILDDSFREEFQRIDVDGSVVPDGKVTNREDLIEPRVVGTSHDANNEDGGGSIRFIFVHQVNLCRALGTIDAVLTRRMEVELTETENVMRGKRTTADVVIMADFDVNARAQIDDLRVIHLLILKDQRGSSQLLTRYHFTCIDINRTLMSARAAKWPRTITRCRPRARQEVVISTSKSHAKYRNNSFAN